MGCNASTPVGEEEQDPFLQSKRANDAIDQSLQMQKHKEKKEMKLLLLGAGESGKSTVLKQLRLLHQGGFGNQERLQYREVIWADAVQSMKILIIEARKMGIPLDCDNPVSNRHLFEQKRLLLSARPLEHIDAGLAGGSDFLSDYVLKYSETSENKRRNQSTGQAQAFQNGATHENGNSVNLQELFEGLSENGTNPAFLHEHQQKQAAATRTVSSVRIAGAIAELWLSLIHI